MTLSLPNPRFERKFVAAGYRLDEVLALVRRHPTAFREAYPSRLVNNVYLDTPSFADYREHVSGNPNRQKTRVRWYGVMNGQPIRPVLERKLKRGLVSGKVTDPLPPVGRDQVISAQGLQKLFCESTLPELVAFSLRFLQPSLFNQYARHYFVSMTGHVRLTIDSALEFAAPARISRGAPQRSASCGELPIIELKFKPEYADEAAAVTNHLPFRLTRCSKYVMGITLVTGL